jgi:hypothetical protein
MIKVHGLNISHSENANGNLLIRYVASLFQNSAIEILELNDCSTANACGAIKMALEKNHLLIVSVPAQKNFDLESYFDPHNLKEVFDGAPLLLLSTSQETISSTEALNNSENTLLKFGANILDTFILTNFETNFNRKSGITNTLLYLELIGKINRLKRTTFSPYYPENVFTCGIDPRRKFFGELDGY